MPSPTWNACYHETSHVGLRLTAANPEFAAKMELAEQIMREDRDTNNDGSCHGPTGFACMCGKSKRG